MEKKLDNFNLNCKIIFNNIKNIKKEIEKTAIKYNREPSNIKLLAATKTVGPQYINFAINNGVNIIGENKVQELIEKYEYIDTKNCEIHFIGHLQTNKVNKIIDKVDMVQSVDSVKLAKEISKHALRLHKTVNILVQVNIGRETNKFGVFEEEVVEFINIISKFNGIKVKGLMVIPPKSTNINTLRKNFKKTFDLKVDIISKNIDNINMNYLSMGMSSDFKEAISEGSDMIRIGSEIFGKRK